MVLHRSESPVVKHSIQAAARRDGGKLSLRFQVDGVENVVGLVPPTHSNRRDDLWKMTCFECFASGKDSLSYWEWNVTPIGDWQAYAFTGYRAGREIGACSAPIVRRYETAANLIYDVELVLPPDLAQAETLDVALTAVAIAPGREAPYYWALAHTGERPDFHRRDSFVLPIGKG